MELQQGRDDRSLGELFGELTREITALVRQEAALAKTEISQKAANLARQVGMMAIGGFLAYAGLLAILAAIIITLAVEAGMEWWAAALVVGLIATGLGAFLVWRGVQAIRHADLAPRQTIETIQEDQQWIRGRAA
jgi:uncharacterized membrane protein YqjE